MTQIPIRKHACFDHSELEFGICLGIGIWDFEFQIELSALPFAL